MVWGLLLLGCLSDIRPEVVRASPALDAEQGRALLVQAADAHGGLARWQAHHSLTVELHDVWQGLMGRAANPWPAADLTLRLDLRLHTFDARATFSDGAVWGISDWVTWQQQPGGPLKVKEDGDIHFILPTMHYFVSFPFRILEAPLVSAAGPVEVGGRRYQTVFATWEQAAPSRDYDQYIVYISEDTGLIEKIAYTVREIAPFVVGAMHFGDFVAAGDLTLPTTMTVTSRVEDDASGADFLHRATLRHIVLDGLPASAEAWEPGAGAGISGGVAR